MCEIEVTLIEAWRCWPGDDLTRTTRLWGLELYWWARIGKVLQTFAIVTIVLELVGPERLARFARGLHGAREHTKLAALVRDTVSFQFAWVWYVVRSALTDEPDRAPGLTPLGYRSDWLHAAVLLTGYASFFLGLWLGLDFLPMFLALVAFTLSAGLVTLAIVLVAHSAGCSTGPSSGRSHGHSRTPTSIDWSNSRRLPWQCSACTSISSLPDPTDAMCGLSTTKTRRLKAVAPSGEKRCYGISRGNPVTGWFTNCI
tara:strand:- start:107 stop:877 length:771 start_codon:yes stop_codon:yes gene_type:complete